MEKYIIFWFLCWCQGRTGSQGLAPWRGPLVQVGFQPRLSCASSRGIPGMNAPWHWTACQRPRERRFKSQWLSAEIKWVPDSISSGKVHVIAPTEMQRRRSSCWNRLMLQRLDARVPNSLLSDPFHHYVLAVAETAPHRAKSSPRKGSSSVWGQNRKSGKWRKR